MDVSAFAQPDTGIFSRTDHQASQTDEACVTVATVRARRTRRLDGTPSTEMLLSGSGTALNGEDALFRAIAEGLERYCATRVPEADVVWASEKELGTEALSLSAFPACSEREIADGKCPLRRADPNARIRWVRGVSLEGEMRYLPAMCVYITRPLVEAERFLFGISTGCAAHCDLETATLSGALEVLERDATSITWLQQLPLRQIRLDRPDEVFGPLWPVLEQCPLSVKYAFFDATTEFGIPIVYGVRSSAHDERLHTLVACSASMDAAAACRKTMLELSSFAIWLRPEQQVPADIRDFAAFHHGPVWMAHKERAEAFSFLLKSGRNVSLAEVQERSPMTSGDDSRSALRKLAKRLLAAGLKAYVVDLGTEESHRAGLRVVRVVIPELMPLAWVQRARFLAHPRLYRAPAILGYPVKQEPQLNMWPQPFG